MDSLNKVMQKAEKLAEKNGHKIAQWERLEARNMANFCGECFQHITVYSTPQASQTFRIGGPLATLPCVKFQTSQAKAKKTRAKIEALYEHLAKLKTNCHHHFERIKDSDWKDKWMSVGAWCKGCGVSFGWRCRYSPDGVCHYDSFPKDGKQHIRLINDDLWPLPEEYDPENESGDWCIFCGHPEERK